LRRGRLPVALRLRHVHSHARHCISVENQPTEGALFCHESLSEVQFVNLFSFVCLAGCGQTRCWTRLCVAQRFQRCDDRLFISADGFRPRTVQKSVFCDRSREITKGTRLGLSGGHRYFRGRCGGEILGPLRDAMTTGKGKLRSKARLQHARS